MTDSTNAETIVPGNGLGALVTTGLVSAIAAFSATLLYFHYFPPVVEKARAHCGCGHGEARHGRD